MSERNESVEKLYDVTVKELTDAITEKRASAAHLAVARALCRDAGISVDPSRPDKGTSKLMASLQALDEEEARPN
jgi:hypothetical protein